MPDRFSTFVSYLDFVEVEKSPYSHKIQQKLWALSSFLLSFQCKNQFFNRHTNNCIIIPRNKIFDALAAVVKVRSIVSFTVRALKRSSQGESCQKGNNFFGIPNKYLRCMDLITKHVQRKLLLGIHFQLQPH